MARFPTLSEARLRSPLLIFVLTAAAASLSAQAPDSAQAATPPDAAATSAPATPAVPPTVLIGMNEDQVMTILGRPVSVVQAGSKKVYSYRSLKVTFLDGKVLEIRDAVRTESADDEVLRDRVSIPVLPLEVGFGAAAIALISFMLGRRERRPAATASSGKFPVQQAQPAWQASSSRSGAQPLKNAEPPSDFLDRLRDLEMLRYLGVLTSEEFEEEKEKLGTPY